jgi:hypothetical protein
MFTMTEGEIRYLSPRDPRRAADLLSSRVWAVSSEDGAEGNERLSFIVGPPRRFVCGL